MAENIKRTQDAVDNTESVLELQELPTDAPTDDVEAHGNCFSLISFAMVDSGPGDTL